MSTTPAPKSDPNISVRQLTEQPRRGHLQRRWVAAVWALYLAAAAAIYSNTLAAPLIFDDIDAIVENSTIRDLTDFKEVFLPKPRGGTTIDGRPLLNFSLAVNYAISRLDPWSYHALNIAIHVLNACLLFGLVRRVLSLPSIPVNVANSASALAFCIGLLWLVHPLQTAAITYVIQRAEALMATFYLGTLYCFVRAATSNNPRGWFAATVLCCWLGQAAKEVMATAPLAVLAMDAALVAGSLRAALRQRWGFYLLLAASWILAAALIVQSEGRSGTVGFNGSLGALNYFVAQCGYLLRYLGLSIWPWPQVFDYGKDIPPWDGSQWLQVLAMCALILGIFLLFWRRPQWGLVGVLPMLILAPTSSFIPVVTHVAAEHRMYLPLASMMTLLMLLLWATFQRAHSWAPRQRDAAAIAIVLLVAVGLGLASHRRNEDFATPRSLWEDTVRKMPENSRACSALAIEMVATNEALQAPALFDRAIARRRNLPSAYYERARAWMRAERHDKAFQDYKNALHANPAFHEVYYDLSLYHRLRKEWSPAMQCIERAIAMDRTNGRYYMHRGLVFSHLGKNDEALADFRKAAELAPYMAEVHFYLGNYYRSHGRPQDAIASWQQALYYNAVHFKAEHMLVAEFTKQGDYRRALQLLDDRIELHNLPADWDLLAAVFETAGDDASAERVLGAALRHHPQSAALHLRLGKLLMRQQLWVAALGPLRTAARLDPRSADAAATLGYVLMMSGDLTAAGNELDRSLAIDPQHAAALQIRRELQQLTQPAMP